MHHSRPLPSELVAAPVVVCDRKEQNNSFHDVIFQRLHGANAELFFHGTSVTSGNAISPWCVFVLFVMALIVNSTPLASGIGSNPGSEPQRHGGVRMYPGSSAHAPSRLR